MTGLDRDSVTERVRTTAVTPDATTPEKPDYVARYRALDAQGKVLDETYAEVRTHIGAFMHNTDRDGHPRFFWWGVEGGDLFEVIQELCNEHGIRLSARRIRAARRALMALLRDRQLGPFAALDCPVCGERFHPTTTTAVYDKPACRQKADRDRRRAVSS